MTIEDKIDAYLVERINHLYATRSPKGNRSAHARDRIRLATLSSVLGDIREVVRDHYRELMEEEEIL